MSPSLKIGLAAVQHLRLEECGCLSLCLLDGNARLEPAG